MQRAETPKQHDRLFKQRRSAVCLKVLRKLYSGVIGKVISRENRVGLTRPHDVALTYGEIIFESFLQILSYCISDIPQRTFIDLGCGTGKPTMCAALSPFGFSKSIGVELISALCNAATDTFGRLQTALHDLETSNPTPAATSDERPSHSKKSSTTAPLSQPELLQIAIQCVREAGGVMRTEDLANQMVQNIGHKRYRSSLKPFKSFRKLLELAPSLAVTDNDVTYTSSNPGEVDESREEIDAAPPVLVQEKRAGEANAEIGGVGDDDLDEKESVTLSAAMASLDWRLLVPLPEIEFVCSDILQFDWSHADVVYSASLLFPEEMIAKIAREAVKLKSGAYFISLKPLLADHLECINEGFFRMSWQMAKVYIYKRT